MIDDARNTRIQHDKFLVDKWGRKGGVPPGLHARVQGDYIKIESSMISPSHWSRCFGIVDDREDRKNKRWYLPLIERGTRVSLVSKKFVTRVTLVFNMTNFYQKQGYPPPPPPRATRARVEIYQNRKGLVISECKNNGLSYVG